MSAYKTMLVPVSDSRAGAAPLAAAFGLAAPLVAHVVALHVRPDPTSAVPMVGEGISGAMVEEMMNAAEAQSAKRAGEARRLFDETCAARGVTLGTTPGGTAPTAEWIDVTGREEEVVAWRGRLADLVVMGRPEPDQEPPSALTLNAALMESGRPLLLIPPHPRLHTLGTRAAIAWNGSAEAGRAVAAALPLLTRAQAVTILSVTENHRTLNATAGDLAAYLAWHGVTAACQMLHAPTSHAGADLLTQAASVGADLLVMGAYTHSRLRQIILGGVTRHVLHHADVACLMCH